MIMKWMPVVVLLIGLPGWIIWWILNSHNLYAAEYAIIGYTLVMCLAAYWPMRTYYD